MGKVYTKLFGKTPVRILVIGLDAAGKTTMLYKMKLGEIVTTIPTIGMNVESVQYKNTNFTTFDVGGRDKIRPLWLYYYRNTDAVVFVVDSNDRERLGEVKDELHRTLSEDDLRDCPFLVMANKQDLPNSMNKYELADKLDLHKFRNKKWYIQSTCAISGDGVYEGFDWLANSVAQNKAKETVQTIQETATKTVTDNKTVTKGWSHALSGIQKMRDWIWSSAKSSAKTNLENSRGV